MAFFNCSIDFQASRTFDDLEEELSRRYLAQLRFIPADRRDARDFQRAEFAEYPIFNHEFFLIVNDISDCYRLQLSEGANEDWGQHFDMEKIAEHRSFQRLLGVLLRQIEGIHDIRINPNSAGPYLNVWQAKARFISRRTVQEVAALIAQKHFCGVRFVPADAPNIREATVFRTEHDILGHQIECQQDRFGSHILTVKPSVWLLNLLTRQERSILQGVDISEWLKAPFRNHPWIRVGVDLDEDEILTDANGR